MVHLHCTPQSNRFRTRCWKCSLGAVALGLAAFLALEGLWTGTQASRPGLLRAWERAEAGDRAAVRPAAVPRDELSESWPQLASAWEQQVDEGEIFLRCRLARQPRRCYREEQETAFWAVTEPWRLDREWHARLDEARAALLDDPARGFDAAADRVARIFGRWVEGARERTAQAAVGLARRCYLQEPLEGRPGAVDDERALMMTGAETYVSPGLLECVDRGLPPLLGAVRENFLSRRGLPGLGEADPAYAAYWDALAENIAVGPALREVFANWAEEEKAVRVGRRTGIIEVLDAELLANPGWYTEDRAARNPAAVGSPSQFPISDDDPALQRCEPVAQKLFDGYYQRLTGDERLPMRFIPIERIRAAWARRACQKTLSNPRFGKARKNNK